MKAKYVFLAIFITIGGVFLFAVGYEAGGNFAAEACAKEVHRQLHPEGDR